MIRFGKHCSLKKGLKGAIDEAVSLGCESMQIFTRSPRMWHMRVPESGEVADFSVERKAAGIHPLIVHTPYLPNLATSNEALYQRSIKALKDDLMVSSLIGADYFVIHPGAYSEGSSPEEGIRRITDALDEAFNQDEGRVKVLLENVAGGGRRLGGSFAEIASMMDRAKRRARLGVCLDTAHALGAGYDLSNPEGVDRALDEFAREIGLEHLVMLHFNDSLVPLGSRKDRHQHLGEGYIGEEGFAHLIHRIRDIAEAGIIETPKDSETADERNLNALFLWRDGTRKKTKENGRNNNG